jgi:hypothetical protein
VILDESAKHCHRKIRAFIAKRLAELIGFPCREFGERVEKIESAKTIANGSSQPDAVRHATCLPKVLAPSA